MYTRYIPKKRRNLVGPKKPVFLRVKYKTRSPGRLVFPWHLGKMFPLVKPEDVEELARLHNLEVKRRD